MSRPELQRLKDIRISCTTVIDYLQRGDISDDIVFDAIRIRLVEIGEATKDLSTETRDRAPRIPWQEIARMRDILTHRYFDSTHAIVENTARTDIPELLAAVEILIIDMRRAGD